MTRRTAPDPAPIESLSNSMTRLNIALDELIAALEDLRSELDSSGA